MGVLVVDDNADWRATITEFVEELGFGEPVLSAGSLADMEEALRLGRPKILILDAGLPDGDALVKLAALRMRFPRMGIIMLTGRVRPADKIAGLKLGADYYLTKPLSLAELEATLIALMRRLRTAPPADGESWQLDPARRTLWRAGAAEIVLSESECRVMAALAQASPGAVSRQQLIHVLGERPEQYDGHRLDVLMHRLRRKLAASGAEALRIKTVYANGYACTAKVSINGF